MLFDNMERLPLSPVQRQESFHILEGSMEISEKMDFQFIFFTEKSLLQFNCYSFPYSHSAFSCYYVSYVIFQYLFFCYYLTLSSCKV